MERGAPSSPCGTQAGSWRCHTSRKSAPPWFFRALTRRSSAIWFVHRTPRRQAPIPKTPPRAGNPQRRTDAAAEDAGDARRWRTGRCRRWRTGRRRPRPRPRRNSGDGATPPPKTPVTPAATGDSAGRRRPPAMVRTATAKAIPAMVRATRPPMTPPATPRTPTSSAVCFDLLSNFGYSALERSPAGGAEGRRGGV